nr:ribonuclease 2 [Tanacetum cinerariifolium]
MVLVTVSNYVLALFQSVDFNIARYFGQWEKHGTCASPVTGDEYNYFITTINLYNTYNVTGVLFEAGYVPSNSEKYPGGGIISALENAFHATPQIICLNGALEEVRLCLTKDFKFRDCVGASDCPDYVSLPEWASSGSITAAGRLFPGHQSF